MRWYDDAHRYDYVSQFDRVVAAHCEIESISAGGVVNEGRASASWHVCGQRPGEEQISRDVLTGCPHHHISTGRGGAE